MLACTKLSGNSSGKIYDKILTQWLKINPYYSRSHDLKVANFTGKAVIPVAEASSSSFALVTAQAATVVGTVGSPVSTLAAMSELELLMVDDGVPMLLSITELAVLLLPIKLVSATNRSRFVGLRNRCNLHFFSFELWVCQNRLTRRTSGSKIYILNYILYII